MTRFREIQARQPAPAITPADDETEELAAEELLEVDVEEVEPELADDPTPFPVTPPPAFKRSKFESVPKAAQEPGARVRIVSSVFRIAAL